MESHIQYQSTKIHYQIKGSGYALVLLHGFMESMHIWQNFVNTLSSGFRVVIIDLPGHGNSGMTDESTTMENMAGCVKQVLNLLQIRQCVMIGHSMGGYVTLAFAELFPEILNGYGLFHSHAAADSAKGKINRDRAIQLIKKDRKGFISAFIPDLFAKENQKKYHNEIENLKTQANNISKQAIINFLEGMKVRGDRLHILQKSKDPVLFIFGKDDTRIPLEMGFTQASLPQCSEIHVLSNVAHMGFIENESYTIQVIKSFTTRCFL